MFFITYHEENMEYTISFIFIYSKKKDLWVPVALGNCLKFNYSSTSLNISIFDFSVK